MRSNPSYDSSLMFLDNEYAALGMGTDRDSWVEAQLIHNFFTNAFAVLRSSLVALLITVAMLYKYVDTAWLATWTVVVLFITEYRFWVVAKFKSHYQRWSEGSEQHFPKDK